MTSTNDHPTGSELEGRAENHRARISVLADALTERLAPTALIDEAIAGARRNGGDKWMANASRAISRNPMPMALAGLAVGYAAHLVRKEDAAFDLATRERVVRNTAVHGAQDSEETSISHLAEDLKEQAASAVDRARSEAKRIETRVRSGHYGVADAVRDHPLAVGALGLGIGAVLASLIPPTRAEDDHIGPVRDKVVHRTRAAVEDTFDTAADYAAARVEAIKARLDEKAPYVSDPHAEPRV